MSDLPLSAISSCNSVNSASSSGGKWRQKVFSLLIQLKASQLALENAEEKATKDALDWQQQLHLASFREAKLIQEKQELLRQLHEQREHDIAPLQQEVLNLKGQCTQLSEEVGLARADLRERLQANALVLAVSNEKSLALASALHDKQVSLAQQSLLQETLLQAQLDLDACKTALRKQTEQRVRTEVLQEEEAAHAWLQRLSALQEECNGLVQDKNAGQREVLRLKNSLGVMEMQLLQAKRALEEKGDKDEAVLYQRLIQQDAELSRLRRQLASKCLVFPSPVDSTQTTSTTTTASASHLVYTLGDGHRLISPVHDSKAAGLNEDLSGEEERETQEGIAGVKGTEMHAVGKEKQWWEAVLTKEKHGVSKRPSHEEEREMDVFASTAKPHMVVLSADSELKQGDDRDEGCLSDPCPPSSPSTASDLFTNEKWKNMLPSRVRQQLSPSPIPNDQRRETASNGALFCSSMRSVQSADSELLSCILFADRLTPAKAKLALATVTTVGIMSMPLVLSRPDIESFPKAFTAHLKAEEAKAVSLGRPSTGFHGGWKDLFLFPTFQNYYVLAKATVPLRHSENSQLTFIGILNSWHYVHRLSAINRPPPPKETPPPPAAASLTSPAKPSK